MPHNYLLTRLITFFLSVMLSPFSYAEESGECNQQGSHLHVIENIKMHGEEDSLYYANYDFYGYQDLYYFPHLAQPEETASYNTVFVLNGKKIITEQQMLDDYEPDVISVEEYQAADKQIVLARVLWGDELYVYEFGYFYSYQDKALTYIGEHRFKTSYDVYKRNLPAGERLIYPDNKNQLAKMEMSLYNNELCVKMTNFNNTKSKVTTYSLPNK